jgi:hypothetical protein
MTTATLTRPGFVTDRTGHALFTSRTAASAWLNTSPRHALQCPDCGEIHDDCAAFDCCGQSSAYPALPSTVPGVYEAVTARDLNHTTEGN